MPTVANTGLPTVFPSFEAALKRGVMADILLPNEIKTERLLLRPLQFSDAEDVLAYANDPEWSRYLPAPSPYSKRDAEEFIARSILKDRKAHTQYAVVYEGRVIGGIDLRFDHENQAAELGWSIARRHWRKGIATEAASAVMDFAFKTYHELNKIYARAIVKNAASWRVMEKLGMIKEGHLRQHRVLKGELFDQVWYDILRKEWQRLYGDE